MKYPKNYVIGDEVIFTLWDDGCYIKGRKVSTKKALDTFIKKLTEHLKVNQ